MSRATDLAQRIAAAFNAGDVEAFAGCFAADAVQHHPFLPQPLQGRQAIRDAEATLFGSFDDIAFDVVRVLEGGPHMAIEARVQGTHTRPLPMPDGSALAATGRRVDLTLAAFLRLDDDGQIAEAHRYQDNLAFMHALGVPVG